MQKAFRLMLPPKEKKNNRRKNLQNASRVFPTEWILDCDDEQVRTILIPTENGNLKSRRLYLEKLKVPSYVSRKFGRQCIDC